MVDLINDIDTNDYPFRRIELNPYLKLDIKIPDRLKI